MALLDDVLQASGGLDLWRQLRRFTVHMSIGGLLCAEKCGGAQLKDLVVEGCTREQELEMTCFTAPDKRALYRPDRVALEGCDGSLLKERRARPAQFQHEFRASRWDDLQLAYYCGSLTWSYLAVPFVLADGDVVTEELSPTTVRGKSLRRLRVRFPSRLAPHSSEHMLYFDGEALLQVQEYTAVHAEQTRVAQMLSGHQRFSGILVPTLCRLLKVGIDGSAVARPSLLDLEIFDAVFE